MRRISDIVAVILSGLLLLCAAGAGLSCTPADGFCPAERYESDGTAFYCSALDDAWDISGQDLAGRFTGKTLEFVEAVELPEKVIDGPSEKPTGRPDYFPDTSTIAGFSWCELGSQEKNASCEEWLTVAFTLSKGMLELSSRRNNDASERLELTFAVLTVAGKRLEGIVDGTKFEFSDSASGSKNEIRVRYQLKD